MKKSILLVLLVVLALSLVTTLAIAGKTTHDSSPVNVTVADPATPLPAAEPQRHCGRIHEAIEALEQSKHELENAAHDYCGHRRAALHAIHEALEQLREAENCADCR